MQWWHEYAVQQILQWWLYNKYYNDGCTTNITIACQWWFLGRADLDWYEWSWPLWGGASNERKNGKFDKYF
jgi:hypothetical protein